VTAAMKRRDVERALTATGCQPKPGSGRSPHSKWRCPCGQHSANIPRHTDISPGVVADTIKRMACLPEGWLQ
jgi:hypothetical protein